MGFETQPSPTGLARLSPNTLAFLPRSPSQPIHPITHSTAAHKQPRGRRRRRRRRRTREDDDQSHISPPETPHQSHSPPPPTQLMSLGGGTGEGTDGAGGIYNNGAPGEHKAHNTLVELYGLALSIPQFSPSATFVRVGYCGVGSIGPAKFWTCSLENYKNKMFSMV